MCYKTFGDETRINRIISVAGLFSLLVKEANNRYKELQQAQVNASMELATLILLGRQKGDKVKFPCKQCVLDIALQFEDLGKMIRELVE